MCEIKWKVDKITKSDVSVLIKGETGKELLVEAIYLKSQRKDKPFVKVDYAMIQKGILRAEHFR